MPRISKDEVKTRSGSRSKRSRSESRSLSPSRRSANSPHVRSRARSKQTPDKLGNVAENDADRIKNSTSSGGTSTGSKDSRRRVSLKDEASLVLRNESDEDTSCNVTKTGEITYPIDICTTKWLVLSSCFFLISAYFAYFTAHLPYFAILSTITTIVSVNHWRDANFGPRRDADRLVAHISFIIYFITGCYYIIPHGGSELFLYALPGCFCILGCYYMSYLLMKRGSERWLYFHFMFHVFVAIEQIIVLRNVK